MSKNNQEPQSDADEKREVLLAENPNLSAGYAFSELHAGRLDWLAEHIRRCDYRIDPTVARKLLELLDGSHPEFELRMGPRARRGPRFISQLELDIRNSELALEVARRGGFDKRTALTRACYDVGKLQRPPLTTRTVKELVRPWRKWAIAYLGIGPIPPLRPWEFDTIESDQ